MRSPAAILGHIFRENAMTVTIPWGHIEAAVFIGCCIAIGAVLGPVVGALWR